MRQSDVDPLQPPDPGPPDTGLRTMLKWTLIALIGSVLFSIVGVYLAIHFLDRP